MRPEADLVIILGSPATGKTTLAGRLSRDLALPHLCKDDVKEALFDVLGCADRARSRLLSEASFTTLVRLARTQLGAGLSCIIEGNWRALHTPLLAAVLEETRARTAQIWCAAQPQEIVQRFTSRQRHAGHLDGLLPAEEIQAAAEQGPAFLELPGPRWLYRSDTPTAYEALRMDIQNWRM
jgi:predicted kinase